MDRLRTLGPPGRVNRVPDCPAPPSADAKKAIGRKIALSSFFNLVNFFVSVPVMILLVPFLLHRLGEKSYGVWCMSNTLLGLIGLLYFGFAPAVMKYVAEHEARGEHERLNRVAATCVACFLVVSLLVTAVVETLGPWLAVRLFGPSLDSASPNPGVAVLRITLLVFWLKYPFAAFALVLSGLQRQDLVQMVNIGNTLGFAAGAVFVLERGGGVVELLWWSAGMAALCQLAFVLLAHRLCPRLSLRPWLADRASFLCVYRFGMKLFTTSFAVSVHETFDKFVLSWRLMRTDLVGLYDIAANLLDKAQAIPANTMGPLLAAASELSARGDYDSLAGLYRRAQRYNTVLATLFFGGVFVVGRPLFTVWLRSANPFILDVSYVLVAGLYARALYLPAAHLLNGLGHPEATMEACLIGGAANLGLGLLFLSFLGPIGLAGGTSVSLVLEMACILRRFSKTVPSGKLSSLLPDVPATLIAFGLSAILATPIAEPASRLHPWPLLTGGCLYVAVYLAVLVALRVVGRQDLVIFRALLCR